MPKLVEVDESDEESSMPIGDGPIETMDIDFEGRIANDSDFEGIKMLLQQLFLQSNVDISEMTNEIISHNYIGCVLHQLIPDDQSEDDDDDDDSGGPVLGVLSVLNLSDNPDKLFTKQLKGFLVEKCSEDETADLNQFKSILSNSSYRIGFLLNEKLICHAHLSLPSFQSLWKDMEKAKMKKMNYDFDVYILLCKTTSITSKKHKAELEFSNPEDEIFFENALLSFSYGVDHDTQMHMATKSSKQFEARRTVIVFANKSIDKIMQQMTLIAA